MLDKLAFYHLDYEAQYSATTEFVDETFKQFNDIKRFWLCLPVGAQCCCRMDASTWIPWEKEKKNIWVRELPKYDYVINEENCPFEYEIGEIDYCVQDKFCEYFQKTYGTTAIVIGLRTDESLNRLRAVTKQNIKNYMDINYLIGNENLCRAYIIYDFDVEDIWIYNAKFNKSYNKLYDLFYQAGLKLNQMRVASPFNDCGQGTLKLYRVIDPKTWGEMVGRTNGVNFMNLYGGTSAMGWKSIKLPKDHTWKSYLDFLLSTLDDKTRNIYLEKFNTSVKFWKEKGGGLDDELIQEINQKSNNLKFQIGEPNNYSNKKVVRFEEYPDEIDVDKNFKEIPSYKRMCICILKNDLSCKYMGFSQTKEAVEKRKKAIEKYKNIL